MIGKVSHALTVAIAFPNYKYSMFNLEAKLEQVQSYSEGVN